MKQWKLGAALAAFAVATVLKLAAPGLGAVARNELADVLSPGKEPAAAVRALGTKLSVKRQSAAPSDGGDAPAAAREDAVIWVPLPTPTPDAAPQEEEAPEEAPAETPVPDVVAAFLETQAAFSDYGIPENVDCGYEELPFAYAVPVDGCSSSGFGYRLHPILQTVRFHYGTDLAAFSGERISAFADGTVRFAGYDDSYGYNVRIDHGNGWETHYAHCSAIYVSVGQQVEKGECIALVGATGLATGPHLHFELIRDGKYLNPEYYING